MERWVEKFIRMDDRTWDRHANRWSVWTRFAVLPLLFLACWSHTWIGPWGAGAAISAMALWLWVNPRIFPAPRRRDGWHDHAVFGERVWLNRHKVPIPSHHAERAYALSALAVLGFAIGIAGAVINHIWLMLIGAFLTYAGKIWFLDRMVWLYRDMKDRDPIYRSWMRMPDNDNRQRKRAA